MKSLHIAVSLASVAWLPSIVAAQNGSVPGTDVTIYEIPTARVYGRNGPAYPNGTAGVAIGHSMANCGSTNVPWLGWVNGSSNNVMLDTYPKIAFMLTRESDGRMVQISGKSHLKHSRNDYNFFGGPCGTCNDNGGDFFYVGCRDTYSTGWNGNRVRLGPTTEVNPWEGTWNPVGSYFDIGDPSQAGYPEVQDGIQDLSTSGFDAVKNRMEVPEQELIVPGIIRGQCHLMIKGEPVANRDNNLVSRQVTIGWSGSSWSASPTGAAVQGSVLTQWAGATTSMGGNGNDDGRFLVAVKVTGPTNGMWHYEYAVHNIDNHRGGAAFRIPMCPTARVENFGFRDIDQDGLNNWTMSRTSTDLEVLAGVDNPLDWNTFYNVWFDCDVAPTAGTFSIDEARPGPGALTVDVSTTVPGLLGNEYLGDGCGITVPAIYGNSAPTSPNLGYAVDIAVEPAGIVLVAFSAANVVGPVGGGCTVYADPNQLLVTDVKIADAFGQASFGLPIPAGQLPIDLTCQAFELVDNGAMLGFLEASNGIKIRIAGSGCP